MSDDETSPLDEDEEELDDESLPALVRRAVQEEVGFRYRRVMWTTVPALIVAALIVAVLAGVAFVEAQKVSSNQHTITTDAGTLKRDIGLIRTLNYKVCVRVNDTRGVTIIRLRQIKTPGARILASDLPLYHCDPSFEDGAHLLTSAQAEAYLKVLAHGKKPGP